MTDSLKPKRPKTGGRTKGTPNKATQEQRAREAELEAARQAEIQAEHRANVARPKKLGKDVLNELMTVAMGYAALFQPKYDPVTKNVVDGDEDRFEKWARMAGEFAFRAANFESPRYRAIYLQTDSPLSGPKPGADEANVLDLQAERDPARATDAYLRLIQRPRAA